MARKNTKEQIEFDTIEAGDEHKKLFSENSPERATPLRDSPDGTDEDMIDGRVLTDYGEPTKYDPNFKGPIHNRSCTDIICCFVFVVFMAGMVVVSIIGYARGDPYRLVYPTDSQGAICGLGKHENKPFLFFFDLVTCAKLGPAVVTGCPTPQVCVEKCPSENNVYINMDRSKLICKYSVDPNVSPFKEMTSETLIKRNLCASYYLESKPIINRCMPSIFAKLLNMAEPVVNDLGEALVRANGETVNGELLKEGTLSLAQFYRLKGTMELVFRDVVNSAHLIVICLLITMALAMLWIVLLRWLTIIMIWLTVFLFIALFGFAAGYSYYRYYDLKNMNMTSEYGLPEEFSFDFDYFLSIKTTWLAFGCTSATIFIIIVLIIIFLCSRIMLAARLISEASVAISHMWCVLAWPLVPFLLQLLVIAYWISSMIYISSMGEPEFYNNSYVASNDVNALLTRIPCDHDANDTLGEICSFVKYGGDTYKKVMLFYMLFMFFWLMNFISALEQMTLAGAFASYYWAWDKNKDIPTFPLASSFFRCLRYHLGSLAFGSLLIAIVQLIRSFLEYINRKLKGTENRVAKFILKCLRCCFWCLEKFLRFVNKNAYIVIAVHGRSFCTAAKDGFMLVMRNVLRAVVLDKVCDFLMFVSKLMIAGAMAIAAFFWFQGSVPLFDEVIPDLSYFLAPVILVALGAYLIADSFFDVYSMAVDTIFICFLEDMERNDGSKERPYYMSKTKNLKKLLYIPRSKSE